MTETFNWLSKKSEINFLKVDLSTLNISALLALAKWNISHHAHSYTFFCLSLSHLFFQVAHWTDRMFAWHCTMRRASLWQESQQIQLGVPCFIDTPTRSSKCLPMMEYGTCTLTLGVQRERWWIKSIISIISLMRCFAIK